MIRRRASTVTRDSSANGLERPGALKLRAELYKLRQRNADLLADNCALRRQRTAVERSVQELSEYLNGLRREAEQLREDNRQLASRLATSGLSVPEDAAMAPTDGSAGHSIH